MLCVGETLSERENSDFSGYSRANSTLVSTCRAATEKLVIAYEPVWAIGTGGKNSFTPDMAQDVHAFIRAVISKNGFQKILQKT